MGLRPTQRNESRITAALSGPLEAAEVSATLPFVIPTGAEGSAVQRISCGNVFRVAYPFASCTCSAVAGSVFSAGAGQKYRSFLIASI